MHGEMLERFPFAELDTPLELAQFVGEIVSCDAFTGKLYFGTGLVGRAQVTLVHVSGEVAFQQMGSLRTCRYYPALADAVVGKDGNGEVGFFTLVLTPPVQRPASSPPLVLMIFIP